jgi:hypothetical protein
MDAKAEKLRVAEEKKKAKEQAAADKKVHQPRSLFRFHFSAPSASALLL